MGLAVMACASLVLAQGSGPHHGRSMMAGHGMGLGQEDGFGPGHRMEMMVAHLELTDDQKASIEKIHADAQAQRLQTRKEMMRLRNELEGELMKDDANEKTVLDLAGKIGDLRTAQQKNGLSNRLAVRQQLTPEQRDKMLMMHAGGKHGGGRGHGRHGNEGFGRGHGRGCGSRGGDCHQDEN